MKTLAIAIAVVAVLVVVGMIRHLRGARPGPPPVYAVTPLAIACLVTGMALSLGTLWGLLRHYWLFISLAVTLLATTILLLHLPTVRTLADRAADPQANPTGLGGDPFHSVGGLVVLVIPLVRNIYKPRGLTHLGWRAQHRERVDRTGIASLILSTTVSVSP